MFLCLQGFPQKAMTKLEDYGFIQSKTKGEYHANNQTMAKLLHKVHYKLLYMCSFRMAS